jgi:hypothetical protein
MAGKDIIYYSQPNIYGRKFKCTKRTAAHLDRTKDRLEKRGKGKYLRIIQGCYNTSVEASAGTHDFDACLDVEISGMSWYEAQKFLRQNGWAAWVRTPAQGFSYHIHMISLPPYMTRFISKVGVYVPGQVQQYYQHRSGLSGALPDNTWFPDNIRGTVLNYRAYILRQKIKDTRKTLTQLKKKLSKVT